MLTNSDITILLFLTNADEGRSARGGRSGQVRLGSGSSLAGGGERERQGKK